jgi:hypothetical protein
MEKRCSHEGCTNKAKGGGVCIRHGAKVKAKRCCIHEGCANIAQKGGVCWRHGAKMSRQRGSEVRPLMGWDADLLFSFNPKYLTKLKMWKKKGRASETKKVIATKIRTLKNVKRVPLEVGGEVEAV